MEKRRYAPTETPVVNITQNLKDLHQQYNIKILFEAKVMTGGVLEHQKLSSASVTDATWANPTCYVRLPHNRFNTKLKVRSRSKETVTKWSIIEAEFARLTNLVGHLDPTTIGKEFQLSISKYNSQATKWSFNLLNHPLVSGMLQSMDHPPILPVIIKEAVMLKERFPFPIPILQRRQNQTIFITQKQASSILANAFMCTFPQRMEGQELPEINFFSLLDGGPLGDSTLKVEKLKCILRYFHRQQFFQEEGNLLSFQRRYLSPQSHPDWKSSKEIMSQVVVNHDGCIEDQRDMLQVDFSNRSIGGGILKEGMVMEEIRFLICPELIVSRLFTEKLGRDEVLFVTGVEQFCKYLGYGSTFFFVGDYHDTRTIDKCGRRMTELVAMNAYNFKPTEKWKQFEPQFVDRELNKCFCAFKPRHNQQHPNPIATGNWGCEVFNGDPELKFIIQWMAASQAGQRELHYFTYGDRQQSDHFVPIIHFLTRKNANVGALYRAIMRFYKKEIEGPPKIRSPLHPKSLFHYFEHKHKW